MTNWNNMTARERDAVVAEKIFGWNWYCCRWTGMTYEEGANPSPHYLLRPEPPSGPWSYCQVEKKDIPQGAKVHCEHPSYTTDIAAAWLVVERMREKGWTLKLESQDRVYPWMAFFSKLNQEKGCSMPWCATAPEAICLAALRALGVAE